MKRIYTVKTPAGLRYVESKTKGQAIAHCVSGDYSAEVTSQSELFEYMSNGGKVEKAEEKKSSSSLPANAAPAQTPASASIASPPAAAHLNAGANNTAPLPLPPGVNPVLAEQQKINPKAAAAAGAPAPVLPLQPATALPPSAPSQNGPVDWEAREQG